MSTQTPTAEAITSVLGPMIEATSYDGYILRVVEANPDRLWLAIDATPEACADCLAPPGVMSGIISDTLRVSGIDMPVEQITIDYPEGETSH